MLKNLSDNSIVKGVTISENKVKRYIKQLHSGTSAGMDGIRQEHLKYALNTGSPKYLAVLLTWCMRFGIVPDTFRYGLLVPIIKKPTLDPCIGKSYRPVVMSVTFAKVLEYYLLEETSKIYGPSSYQLGYIPGRNTQMASSLMYDIGVHYNFHCSPDASYSWAIIKELWCYSGVVLECYWVLHPQLGV